MPLYRVKEGKNFGLHRGGEIVEHEAKDAAPYVGTHLELLTEAEAKNVQLAPKPLPTTLAHFADMNALDTIQAAKSLTADERKKLLVWERANQNRTTITSALEREEDSGKTTE